MGHLLLAVLLLLAPVAPGKEDFVVVTHPATATRSLSREQVSRLFLRKAISWPTGELVFPVDQPASSAVRGKFEERVHGRSASSLRLYWQQLVFSGRGSPPPERPNDAAVLEYVRSTPGAIGYVSGKSGLQGVRALAIEN